MLLSPGAWAYPVCSDPCLLACLRGMTDSCGGRQLLRTDGLLWPEPARLAHAPRKQLEPPRPAAREPSSLLRSPSLHAHRAPVDGSTGRRVPTTARAVLGALAGPSPRPPGFRPPSRTKSLQVLHPRSAVGPRRGPVDSLALPRAARSRARGPEAVTPAALLLRPAGARPPAPEERPAWGAQRTEPPSPSRSPFCRPGRKREGLGPAPDRGNGAPVCRDSDAQRSAAEGRVAKPQLPQHLGFCRFVLLRPVSLK